MKFNLCKMSHIHIDSKKYFFVFHTSKIEIFISIPLILHDILQVHM